MYVLSPVSAAFDARPPLLAGDNQQLTHTNAIDRRQIQGDRFYIPSNLEDDEPEDQPYRQSDFAATLRQPIHVDARPPAFTATLRQPIPVDARLPVFAVNNRQPIHATFDGQPPAFTADNQQPQPMYPLMSDIIAQHQAAELSAQNQKLTWKVSQLQGQVNAVCYPNRSRTKGYRSMLNSRTVLIGVENANPLH